MSIDDDFNDWWADEQLEDLDWKQVCKKLYIQMMRMNDDLKYIYDLVPMKYKKLINKEGGSPFFAWHELQKPPTSEEYEAAKARMADLMEKCRK